MPTRNVRSRSVRNLRRQARTGRNEREKETPTWATRGGSLLQGRKKVGVLVRGSTTNETHATTMVIGMQKTSVGMREKIHIRIQWWTCSIAWDSRNGPASVHSPAAAFHESDGDEQMERCRWEKTCRCDGDIQALVQIGLRYNLLISISELSAGLTWRDCPL